MPEPGSRSSRREESQADVAIAGGGPAGSALATFLALRGLSVTLVEKERFPRYHIGESLTPKVQPFLDLLGVADAVAAAGFVRMSGNLHLWSEPRFVRTPFLHDGAPADGYQADRARFDRILLDRARGAGVRVLEGRRVGSFLVLDGRPAGLAIEAEPDGAPGETVRARFVADATGFPGLLARQVAERRADPDQRNVAFAAYYADASGPEGESFADTYVEVFEDGWVWSLPLADGTRNVTVTVDKEDARGVSAEGILAFYRARLEKARHAAAFVKDARLALGPRGFDTTWYASSRFAGPGFFLVGDSAAFVDVLTSQGVYRALRSALNASVAIASALEDPGLEAVAADYYEREERLGYGEYCASVSEAYAGVSRWLDAPFWRRRSRPNRDAVRVALPSGDEKRARRDELKALGRDGRVGDLRFRSDRGASVARRPVVQGGRLQVEPVVLVPTNPRGFRYDPSVDLARVLPLVDGSRSVREIVAAYLGRSVAAGNQKEQRPLMETLTRLYEDGVLGLAG